MTSRRKIKGKKDTNTERDVEGESRGSRMIRRGE